MPAPNAPVANFLFHHLATTGVTAYLVGGYVRDLLLGRENYDLDIAVAGDAIRLGRAVADALSAGFYVLDPLRGTTRVLVTREEKKHVVDFTVLKDGDLLADLAARDFTINAMALAVEDADPDNLIDPFGGRLDLERRQVRAVSPSAFRDDPIRVVRAIRFAHELNLSLDRTTRDLLVESAPNLTQISPERLRDEFYRVLELTPVVPPLVELHETGTLWSLLERFGCPQQPEQREEAVARAAESLNSLEALLWQPGGETPSILGDALGRAHAAVVDPYRRRLWEHMEARFAGERSRLSLLKLTALLIHCAGLDTVATGLAQMRLSRAEIQTGERIAASHSVPRGWAEAGSVSPSELHRFFREAGSAGVDALVLFTAEALAGARRGERANLLGPQTSVAYAGLNAYFEQFHRIVNPPTLVTGDMILKRFDLAPGPRIRRLLDRVREEQAEGRVQTTDQAFEALERAMDAGEI